MFQVYQDSKLIAVMVVCTSKKLCTKSKIMDVTIIKDSECLLILYDLFFLFSGETVITDHVRSIVRECLQEADVKWTSSYEPDVNGNHLHDPTDNDDVEQPVPEKADNLV